MGSQIRKLRLYEKETSNKSLKLQKYKAISENTRYEIKLVKDKLRLKMFIREFNKYDIMSETLISYTFVNTGAPNDYSGTETSLKFNSVLFKDHLSGKQIPLKDHFAGEQIFEGNEISDELALFEGELAFKNIYFVPAVFHSMAAIFDENEPKILLQCDNACKSKIRGING